MIQLITEQVTGRENARNEIQKKETNKQLKNVKKLDESGKLVYRPLHRVEFQRMTLKQHIESEQSKNFADGQKTEFVDSLRFYNTDYKLFKRLLSDFNNASFQTACKQIKDNCQISNRHNFECTGLANVRLKFCTRCCDRAKNHKLERYYIDVNQQAHYRTILCYGCMGMYLNFHSENINSDGGSDFL